MKCDIANKKVYFMGFCKQTYTVSICGRKNAESL